MTTVDLDAERHIQILSAQRSNLLTEIGQLRAQIMDLEIIVDALTQDDSDADE